MSVRRGKGFEPITTWHHQLTVAKSIDKHAIDALRVCDRFSRTFPLSKESRPTRTALCELGLPEHRGQRCPSPGRLGAETRHRNIELDG